MDRFVWYKPGEANEQIILQAANISIYDGHHKQTSYEKGNITLTIKRIIWADPLDSNCRLSLDHSLITNVEKVPKTSFFGRSGKLIVKLKPTERGRERRDCPVTVSGSDFIRISFKNGDEEEFYKMYIDAVKKVDQKSLAVSRGGIAGIEKHLEKRHERTSLIINKAFEDMNNLMEQAKIMVDLSRKLTEWINSKKGEFTDDEIIKFKSSLLGLGIDDPVTKENFGSGEEYFKKLSRELTNLLLEPLKNVGGIMTLPEVYCRINRARGVELISPEDLLKACKKIGIFQIDYHLISSYKKFGEIGSPLQLITFKSGVSVIELRSTDTEKIADEVCIFVEKKGHTDAQQLAVSTGISTVLALERLLMAENFARLCRDDSIEGLFFYPNKFLL